MDKTHVIDWRHYREQDGGAGMLQSVPAKVDNAARWLEPQQSSRDTLRGEEWISCPQAALLYCQLGANQIILLQSDKKAGTSCLLTTRLGGSLDMLCRRRGALTRGVFSGD